MPEPSSTTDNRRLVINLHGPLPVRLSRAQVRELHDELDRERSARETWDGQPSGMPVLMLGDDGTAAVV